MAIDKAKKFLLFFPLAYSKEINTQSRIEGQIPILSGNENGYFWEILILLLLDHSLYSFHNPFHVISVPWNHGLSASNIVNLASWPNLQIEIFRAVSNGILLHLLLGSRIDSISE